VTCSEYGYLVVPPFPLPGVAVANVAELASARHRGQPSTDMSITYSAAFVPTRVHERRPGLRLGGYWWVTWPLSVMWQRCPRSDIAQTRTVV
jgi:hypothetical protein